ncbi:MAG: NifB/NifX family molybdenum-iron cluster-binding protein [Gammaproteobacteria bacterium]|nr:NifB/NifX family molybdenum-iron cluster-binding protein [Gammaproteobacteria bacterium]
MRRFLSILVVLVGSVLLTAGSAHASEYQDDTFAIAAEGQKVSAKIAHLSGPAPYFHIVDINGTPLKVLANPHLDLEFGIGPAAAATLGDMGVTVLVGGMAGPKMMDVLDAKGVRFVPRVGKVRDVVKELQE